MTSHSNYNAEQYCRRGVKNAKKNKKKTPLKSVMEGILLLFLCALCAFAVKNPVRGVTSAF
jgi:hypothetical protein